MLASWWDNLHGSLWRIAGRADLLAVQRSARLVAREFAAPLRETRSACGWSADQARLLAALDANGLTGILSAEPRDLAMHLSLSLWELASVDGGTATLSMSGFLAQMPIRDFGTAKQKDRYIGRADCRHGALCLTEPIPGAGADAIFLSGRVRVAGESADGEPMLEVAKRGRFTSHTDFADFVVAAVSGDGVSLRGSCLVILKPDDDGLFERGAQVRKLGHRLASTTNPNFDLKVPASRIVGGYTAEDGVLIPRCDQRQLLDPALRRTRALLSLMTASKALSTVVGFLAEPKHSGGPGTAFGTWESTNPNQPSPENHKHTDLQPWLSLAELWAVGEAAASLGFSAVRSCDEFDRAEEQTRTAALLPAAAKLFSSSRLPELLRQVAASELCASADGFGLREKICDAQVESMYMGPEALQRRQLSAAMIHPGFLAELRGGIEELEAPQRPGTGSLAAGVRLWLWTLDQLRRQTDARGARLYADARQGVTFAMADALADILAARALIVDVFTQQNDGFCSATDARILADLCTLAAGRAAGRVAQTCVGVYFGYAERFPIIAEAKSAFDDLQRNLCHSLNGTRDAQLRLALFLCGAKASL
jgi:alkylation response protein AidB-like acyl-CoA dehydrogenase